MALTTEQVHEAIEQVLVDCELRQAEYHPTGLRESLYRLGYVPEDADQVVEFCYEGGFQYCLDPSKGARHFDPNGPGHDEHGMVFDYPSEDACLWGPDQLASRLHSLSNYRAKRRS
jgi:hypothetical protein